MEKLIEVPKKLKRNFVSEELMISSWDDLRPYFEQLQNREISSALDLEKFIKDSDELDTIISEDYAWRYIHMTCATDDDKIKENYLNFVSEIEPKISPELNKLQKKIIDSPFIEGIDREKYFIYLRSVKKSLELFRESNIPLLAEISKEVQLYGSITGAQSVIFNGEEITLQKASSLLKKTDRKLREDIYFLIQKRKDADEEKLNNLFTTLLKLRHQVALNAGFKNYRDYKFEELGRFDYTIQDCYDFHESIYLHLVPIVKKLEQKRKKELGYADYRPWDTEVDSKGNEALRPFNNSSELISKTIACFEEIDPYFASCIDMMDKMKHLDLESRIGKAPGGYNYPLHESGAPFIFMNSVGSHRDLVTMVHEGGHAVHSFLMHPLELSAFKNPPSEVAELASMSMELISMEHWHHFFPNESELIRAKKEQLEKVLKSLTWIAAVDKFQHWLYENNEHNQSERYACWNSIMNNFGSGEVNYHGLEKYLNRSWQSQLHIYEVPFYYIEYGMAQLGAIAVWKNYKQNPQQAITAYSDALKTGYTEPIGEIYKKAGIAFDFSSNNVKSLAEFVLNEWEKLAD